MNTYANEVQEWKRAKRVERIALGSMHADPRAGESWAARLLRLVKGGR